MFLYFILAFFAAISYSYIHASIGSPEINQNGVAVCYRGMIGSNIGSWICAKYNAFQSKQLDTARAQFEQRVISLTKSELLPLLSSYASLDFLQTLERSELVKFAHQNSEHIIAASLSFNPYKAVFICPPCSLFWFGQVFIIPALVWAVLGGLHWGLAVLLWLGFAPLLFFFFGLTAALVESR